MFPFKVMDMDGASSSPQDGDTNNIYSEIKALASACLVSFAVAYGDSGKLLMTISAMLMTSTAEASSSRLLMPAILVSLQRSVISVMVGRTDHPDYMTHGVTSDSLCDAFQVNFKSDHHQLFYSKSSSKAHNQGLPKRVFSLASDGSFLYMQSDKGLFKVGTGYAGKDRAPAFV